MIFRRMLPEGTLYVHGPRRPHEHEPVPRGVSHCIFLPTPESLEMGAYMASCNCLECQTNGRQTYQERRATEDRHMKAWMTLLREEIARFTGR